MNDQESQDGSISLVSLDLEEVDASHHNEKWKGVPMTTLLFPSD